MFSKTKFFPSFMFLAVVFFGVFAFSPDPASAGLFSVNLSANPNVIPPGGTASINWWVAWGSAPKAPYDCGGNLGTFTIPDDPTRNYDGVEGGSFSVSPSQTTDYTLSCVDSEGTRETETLKITVSSIPVVTIDASPRNLPAEGGSSVITWTVGEATRCTQSGGTADWRSYGNMHLGGTISANITSTTTFSLECFNSRGDSSGLKSVIVTASSSTSGHQCTGTPPYLIASSTYIEAYPGDTSDLLADTSWAYSATDTSRKCEYHCKPGSNWVPNQEGSMTCSAGGGGDTTPPPNLPTIYAYIDNPIIRPGESSVIHWTTTNAVSCEIFFTVNGVQGPRSSIPVSGQQTVSPSGSGYYEFFCLNSDGQGQMTSIYSGNNQSVKVDVTAVPVVDFSATPMTVNSGDQVVFSWSVTDAAQGCSLFEGFSIGYINSKPQPQGTLLLSVNPTTTTSYTHTPTATKKYGLYCVNYGPAAGGWLYPTTVKELTITVSGSGNCPNAACAAATCQSQTCNDGCGNIINGTKICSSNNTGPGGTTTGNTGPILGSAVLFQNPLKFNNINDLVTSLLVFFQGLIVVLALIFIIVGAFLYITSGGNDHRMETGKKAILAAIIGLALGIAAPAFLREIGSILGWTTPNIPSDVGTSLSLLGIMTNVLSFLLTIIGIIAIIMLVIGGFLYLTAAGDEDRIDRGKKIVKYSIIGILIALAALVLVKQVAGFFVDPTATSASGGSLNQGGGSGGAGGGSGGGGSTIPAISPGDYTYTFDTSDGQRTYVLHVPSGYDGTESLPLLVHLHGGTGTAATGNQSTNFSNLADTNDFFVVYGQGTTGNAGLTSWNAGGCCGASQEKNNDVDDVGYIQTVITQVKEKVNVAQNRIYVSGMSNGSMLANRLACEIPNLLAGVATVSGTTQVSSCNPSKTIPHIIIHGTADTNVPYNGGKSGSPLNSGTFVAVEDELQVWSQRNGCGQSLTTTVAALPASDGTSADKLNYPCPSGKEVVLYRINNGSHSWPGGGSGTNDLELVPSQAINASQTILNFFQL